MLDFWDTAICKSPVSGEQLSSFWRVIGSELTNEFPLFLGKMGIP
jgi:hypothetical protein